MLPSYTMNKLIFFRHYLALRSTLLYRAIREDVGFVYFFVFLVLVSYLSVLAASRMSALLWAGFPVLILRIHQRREDINLLKQVYSYKGVKRLLLGEYLILSIPFVVGAVSTGHYLLAVALVGSVVVINYAFPIRLLKHKPLPSPFGVESFEWIFFTRKYLIYLLCGTFLFLVPDIGVPNATAIFSFLATLLVLLSYSEQEPREYVSIYRHMTPHGFLRRKAVLCFRNYSFLVLPVLLLANGLAASSWAEVRVQLLALSLAYLALLATLLTKYALYGNPLAIKIALGFLLGLVVGVLLNPAFLIVLLLVTLVSYRRSMINLSTFFYADN